MGRTINVSRILAIILCITSAIVFHQWGYILIGILIATKLEVYVVYFNRKLKVSWLEAIPVEDEESSQNQG
jgi:hypothetical protein